MKTPTHLPPGSRPVAISSFHPLFHDSITGLPSAPLIMESMRDLASEHGKIGIIFIDTTHLETLEKVHNWEWMDSIYSQLCGWIESLSSEFAPLRMFAMHRVPGDNLILVVSPGVKESVLSEPELADVSARTEEILNRNLAEMLPSQSFGRLFHGYSILEYNSDQRFERLLARTINRAFQNALGRQVETDQEDIRQLEEIVRLQKIRTLFQPIFALGDHKEILGHEALSRGPEGTAFETAEILFSMAERCGMLTHLERVCQKQILSALETQSTSKLLFVNMEPSLLEQESYLLLPLFDGRSAQNVVLEVTERIAITDYRVVARALESIRSRGFRVAVDDAGSGFASLESIAYLKPDYIKISEKLVQGISNDYIKQEIVRTLRDMAWRLSASVIAEGIEDEMDLNMLIDLGISYGQGYLLQRPAERLLG